MDSNDLKNAHLDNIETLIIDYTDEITIPEEFSKRLVKPGSSLTERKT